MMPIERHRPHVSRGFTLIELLVVIVVMGILATIAVPRLNVTRHRAYRTAVKSDLRNVAEAQELHVTQSFVYASDLTSLEATESEAVSIAINEATGDGWAATATHSGLAGEQCGVYYGDAAAAGGSPATTPGVVACSF